MGRIRGITVTLIGRTQTGTDVFNRPVYADTEEEVENVLIGEPTSEEIVDTLELTGKKLAYTLSIPKGDVHTWSGRKVRFFDEVFQVIGAPTQGIEDMIPLSWNRKVKVERIE